MPVIVTSVKTLPKQSIRRYVQPLIVAITMPRISLKKNRDKLDALATALIEKKRWDLTRSPHHRRETMRR